MRRSKHAADQWVYRGHADADWLLLPGAHRSSSWTAFTPQGTVDHERTLIRRFQEEADAQGLSLLGAHLVPADWEVLSRQDWPRPDIIPLLALAQHHGVPTRLLDWTRHGRIAAYFASLPPPSDTETLAIGALNGTFVRARSDKLKTGYWDIVSAPRASNSNLHAQAGMFTYVSSGSQNVLPFDDVVSGVASGYIPVWGDVEAHPSPLMRKLSLSREHAHELLARLYLEGVSALSLFPGFDGVVKHLILTNALGIPSRSL